MTSHTQTTGVALVSLTLFAAGCADRSAPPPRSAPELELLSATASPGATDRLRSELTWYDRAQNRVVRLREGRVEIVQNAPLSRDLAGAEPDALRVFDDGSFIVLTGGALHLYPMGGEHSVLDLESIEVGGVDGASIDDFWVNTWALDTLPGSTGSYGVCQVVRGAIERCVAFPNVGGFTPHMAVAADGSVYATDRDDGLYRFDGSTVTEIARFDGGVTGFRRTGASILATTYQSGAIAIDGSTVRRVTSESYLTDLVGTAEDFYYATYDGESVKIDPGCEDGWFDACDRRDLWTQRVIWHVVSGHRTEAGHENCTDQDRSRCDLLVQGMGLDGDRVVVLGSRLRAVAVSLAGT